MITNTSRSKNFLIAKGLKPTYQRLKILEYLVNHRTHPTVEKIYEELVKEIPTISKTTIYNTLNALVKKDIIHALTITGTEIRYDYNGFSHHHFLCKSCGKVIDIDIRCPYFEKKEVDGHRIEELHGYFKGICKECSKKKKSK